MFDFLNRALFFASERGYLLSAKFLVMTGCVDLKFDNSRAFRLAAENGHLPLVEYFFALEDIDPAVMDNYPIRKAAENGHLDMVQYLAELDSVDPAAKNNEALFKASENGHLAIAQYLCGLNTPISQFDKNKAFIQASASGQLSIVKYFASLDIYPSAKGSAAILLAAKNGHVEVVRYLLDLKGINPSTRNNSPVRKAIQNGHIETVQLLLLDPRVSGNTHHLLMAERNKDQKMIALLKMYLQSPRDQMDLLIKAKNNVVYLENLSGVSGHESATDLGLEQEAVRQARLLSSKYQNLSLKEGLPKLRSLVFGALLTHLEKKKDRHSLSKARFLKSKMKALISGDIPSFKAANDYFKSNADIYEIAFRALNPKAPHLPVNPIQGGWVNLMTSKGEAGQWAQRYAIHIAHEIIASEGKPHYEPCVLALIYRLAEIRRANNRGNTTGLDNPSCFPGTKSRLGQILIAHPDHAKAEWRTTFYEGASRHVQKIFQNQIKLFAKDNSKQAKIFIDALLMFNLDNAKPIKDGRPIMMSSGEMRPYKRAHLLMRSLFIEELKKELLLFVNEHLISHMQNPILREDLEMAYPSFCLQGLGESWIASSLSEIYAHYISEIEASEDSEYKLDPKKVSQLESMALQRRIQQLKMNFYSYCEQYSDIDPPLEKVNDFFKLKRNIPENETEQRALFESLLSDLEQDSTSRRKYRA